MVDFVKRLNRRVKSVVKNDNDFPPPPSPLQLEAESSSKKSHHHHFFHDSDDSDSDVFGKFPKGLRKSLRKLKWKRKDSSRSSRDHLDDDHQVPADVKKSSLNKRWSYSPGICEDGRRRSSSRKLTVSLQDNMQDGNSSNMIDDDDFQSLFKEKRLSFHNDGSICFKDEFFRSYDNKLASRSSTKSFKSSKPDKKQTVSADNLLLGGAEVDPEVICSLVASSSSYQFLDDDSDDELEREEPQELQDIEDALDGMNLRSGTSSFRDPPPFSGVESRDQRSMTLRSISDSLMRVRTGSHHHHHHPHHHYEDDAEYVLENITSMTSSPDNNHPHVTMSPSPIGEESNENSDQGAAENEDQENKADETAAKDAPDDERQPSSSLQHNKTEEATSESNNTESYHQCDDMPPPPSHQDMMGFPSPHNDDEGGFPPPPSCEDMPPPPSPFADDDIDEAPTQFPHPPVIEISSGEPHHHRELLRDNDDDDDDGASWGTSEWDTSDDDVLLDDDEVCAHHRGGNHGNNDNNKMLKTPVAAKLSINSNDSSTSKQNRVSRNLQSFKFWERGSTKKKERSEDGTDEQVNSFIALPHSRTLKNLSRARLPPVEPISLSDKQRKRRYILQTIIETENSYLDALMRLEYDYKQTLLESKPQIVGSEVVEKMFYKISEILQCHQLFQIALASAVNKWDATECVGETFVASFSKSMVLECYGGYINNFSIAMELVRKTCVRKPQFIEFLRQRQLEASSRVNLFGLMLKPVQRFPQFILLIQDLLKHTEEEHDDRLQLQLALTELEILTERLNQRKADDENRADLKLLIENSNLKLPVPVKNTPQHVPKLLKQGEIQECEHNEDGLLEKVKICSLVLTTDMLICCAINTRRSLPRTTNSTMTKDVTYKLKWRVNLEHLQVYDGVSSYHDQANRETLHSDFIVLQRMCKLSERLQHTHEGISSQIFEKSLAELEKKIRQAEQTTRQPEHFSLTVKFPWKSGFTHRTIVFSYVSQKDEWLENIKNAQLAHAPSNIDSWYISDTAEGDATWKSPLFVRAVPAHLTYETLQVECGHAFMQSPQVTLLWLSCVSGNLNSLVSVYYVTEERVEKVHVMQVESCVRCFEHWNPNGAGDSVWLGLESGRLLEYSAGKGNYHEISDVTMPTESSVMLIKSHDNLLFVGLLEGKLLMYRRQVGQDNVDNGLEMISSIVVGSEPLIKLFSFDQHLWAFSGNNVLTMDIKSFRIENCRPLPIDEDDDVTTDIMTSSRGMSRRKRQVKLVTRVGSGMWVAFDGECRLNLYYIGTLKRLQEVNLSRIIRDFVQELGEEERYNEVEPYHITALENGNSQLYVGTSNGLLLVMPLPKLPDSVPKITGPCKVSRYSLNGPLNFLFAPHLPTPFKPPSSDDDVTYDVTPSHRSESTSSHPVATNHKPDVHDDQGSGNPDEPPPVPKRDDDKVASNGHSRGGLHLPIVKRRNHHHVVNPRNHYPSSSRHNMRRNPSRSSSLIEDGESLLDEDDSIYHKRALDSIVSPQKLAFIDWERLMKSSRQCSMVLASGRGYKRCQPTSSNSDVTSPDTSSTSERERGGEEKEQPTILCWKIVL